MMKFKVGDKVVRVDGKPWVGDKEYLTVTGIWESGIIELNGHATVWEEYELKLYEEVKENKMEKTFREVIADIKPGEVWENSYRRIELVNGDIQISKINGKNFDTYILQFSKSINYKLKRAEYTFEEAFKAYEEGKEIESCKFKYKKRNGQDYFYSNTSQAWEKHYEGFILQEIRGKWYIN